MDIPFDDKVRERAYAIWLAAGAHEGDADLHWMHAEQAVRDEMDETALVAPATCVKSPAAGKVVAKVQPAKVQAAKARKAAAGKGKSLASRSPDPKDQAPRRSKVTSNPTATASM